MDVYSNYLTLQHRVEAREGHRRQQEAKRQEWVNASKYYESWERQSKLQEKFDAQAAAACSTLKAFSRPGTLDSGGARRTIDDRRNELQTLMSRDDVVYKVGLQKNTTGKDRLEVDSTMNQFGSQGNIRVRPIPEKCDLTIRQYIPTRLAKETSKASKITDSILFTQAPPTSASDHRSRLKDRRDRLRRLLLKEKEMYDMELKYGRRLPPSETAIVAGIAGTVLSNRSMGDGPSVNVTSTTKISDTSRSRPVGPSSLTQMAAPSRSTTALPSRGVTTSTIPSPSRPDAARPVSAPSVFRFW